MKTPTYPLIIITTSYPSEDLAKEICHSLLQEKKIACAQISAPIQSYYQWNGHIESSTEYSVQIKAPLDQYDAIKTRILTHHPYEIPELYAIRSELGSPEYQNWVYSSCEEANS